MGQCHPCECRGRSSSIPHLCSLSSAGVLRVSRSRRLRFDVSAASWPSTRAFAEIHNEPNTGGHEREHADDECDIVVIMAIKTVDDLIRTFAMDLQALVRDQLSSEVNAAVQAALGGKQGGRGRPPKVGRNGKRTPAEIEKQAAKLLAFIGKNADQRAEQIAGANGLTTGELVRPIKRLLAEKKIKASGKARGTTYAITK